MYPEEVAIRPAVVAGIGIIALIALVLSASTLAFLPGGGLPPVRAITPQTSGSASAVSTTLSFTTATSLNYNFDAKVYATTAGGSSLNFQIATLASGATLVVVAATCQSGTTTAAGETTLTATNILASSPTGTPEVCDISGTLTVGTVATVIQINFDNPAAAGTTTVLVGSFMSVQVVA